MNELLAKLKALPVEFRIFGLLFVLSLLRFSGLFDDAVLPGWDTPSHFFTLQKLATDYLPDGHIGGYLPDWLGGMPLFNYYAPLLFIVTAGLWWLLFKTVSLLFLFRLVIFVCLLGVCAAFWNFVRVYAGRPAARWALVLSACFVFYPKAYSVIGIGAGATIWAGLISSTAGVALTLFMAGWFGKFRSAKVSRLDFAVSVGAVAALALTHTISYIVGGMFVAAFALHQARSETRAAGRAVTAFLLGSTVAAFWLVPFLAGSRFTASEIRGLTDLSVNPLLLIFPLKMPCLAPAALALLFFSTIGFWFLWRDKRRFIPFLTACLTVLYVARAAVSWLLPGFTIHYQRLLPFMFLLVLAAAAAGLQVAWEKWAQAFSGRRLVLSVAAGVMAGSFFFAFDLASVSFSGGLEFDPPAWRWDEFAYADEAGEVVDGLARRPDVGRVFVQMPPEEGLARLGSLHYFSSELPLAGVSVISGLYVESSPLTPFVMPTVGAFAEGKVQAYGDQRLHLVDPFVRQPAAVQLDRLRFLGVTHVVAYSPDIAAKLAVLPGVRAEGGTRHFPVFRIADAFRPVIALDRLPGVYVDSTGTLPFREVATALYGGETSWKTTVFDGGRSLAGLQASGNGGYSFVVMNAGGLAAADIGKIAVPAGYPLILLNCPDGFSAGAGTTCIGRFEIIPRSRRFRYADWPSGWTELQQAVVREADAVNEIPASVAVLSRQDDRNWTVSGAGPRLLSYGFTPYWQPAACESCSVAMATPAYMLIDGPGEVRLEYGDDGVAAVSKVVSLLALILTVSYSAWPKNTRNVVVADGLIKRRK